MRRILILILISTAVSHAWADGFSNASCNDQLAAKHGIASRATGLGRRGLIGYEVNPSAERKNILAGLGIVWWFSKVFLVENEQEALALEAPPIEGAPNQELQQARAINPQMRGFYVIMPGLKVAKDMSEQQLREITAKISNQPMYEVFDGKLVQLDPELVRERVNFKGMTVEKRYNYEEAHLAAWGYHFSNPYGIFILDEMSKENSKGVKKLEAKSRAARFPAPNADGSPATERIVFTFNKDLRAVAQGARDQERVGQIEGSNRIKDKDIEEFLEDQSHGGAISVEAWKEIAHPDGSTSRTLVAGIFGPSVDGMVTIDSTFYPPGDPDLARMCFLALRDRLKAAGMPFSPAILVSNWSAILKGRYITVAEAIKWIDSRPKGVRPDFSSDWVPEADDKMRARPFGYAHPQ